MSAQESSGWILKILDRFRGLIVKAGADYDMLRRILQMKLLMDSRRIPIVLASNRNREEQDKNWFVRSLWLYGVMGVFLAPLIAISDPMYMMPMSILAGVLMFFIMTSMISDFSTVLLDVRDRSILMTKPLHERTVGMARSIHAGIYLILLTGALSAASLVTGLIMHGIGFFFIFAVELILMNMLILVSTSMVYLLILKYGDGEKLKDLINFVQIGLSAMLAIGYQFVIRSFDLLGFQVVFTPAWWQVLLPPVWYAAPFEWLLGDRGEGGWVLFLAGLAVLVPLILMLVYVRYIPSFELYLEKLTHSDAGSGKVRNRLDRVVSRWISRSSVEQACFRLSSSMLRNEREFKLKVYPSLALSMLLPYLFFFSLRGQPLADIRASNSFYVLYTMLFMIVAVVLMLRFSGKPKAFWLFQSAPMQSLAPLYYGALKAFAVKMFLPLFTVQMVVFLVLFGLRVLPDLFVMLLTGTMLIPLTAKAFLRRPPFSEAFSVGQAGDGWIIFLFFFIIGAFGGIHFAISLIPFGIWIYLLLLLFINGLAWTKLYK
ncbi:hypothetical protein JCM10914A_36610 [Paenibacillus sp. JCM 10914]|uniref:hypothetical protein n=1 Tax=Paenibacillus sp. JCM 10914 TaxID=1236974 RepID=UPI0003CCA45B|nr:hypothetical protein [Paenibacillus sp. JCM 10914]GAE04332.1 hypothetical protein JCM10914_373 [Paenibacillus sp. JCM 10914]